MEAKNISNYRKRLSSEHKNLVQAINRNRLAVKELNVDNTEDEFDLART